MTGEQPRKDVVHYWWQQANESLFSAERELGANAYAFVVNRLYYAAFYAVSAALLERHFSFKKHSGVRAVFHREFIKTGLLDKKWGQLYDQLFEDRQEGDYVAFIAFDQAYVEAQLKQCSQFLKVLEPLISTLREE